jgi:uncharacterized protein (DUF1501 family)
MNRRQFLLGSLASAGLVSSPMTMGMNLGLGQRLLAQTSTPIVGYKALVCIFLYGGHDSLNLLVPTDATEYNSYAHTRQNLAYAPEAVTPITPLQTPTYSVGMPSSATSLLELFNQDKLVIVSNVGPMREMAVKDQILANKALRPPQLFSHNDQQALWQAGVDSTNATTGWAGRMADLLMDTSNPLSMNMTTYGSNLWQSGIQAQSFAVNTEGPQTFDGLDPAQDWNLYRYDAFARIRALSSHPLTQEYSRRIDTAEVNNTKLIEALAQLTPSNIDYPRRNPLSDQLKMTADLIQSQTLLGHNRQIFFVGLGGFDTHDNQVERLPDLVNKIGDAMLAFQNDLTARGVSQYVTTFTQSDFGRTLTSNGDGTDHGWGGHQLVMGDDVIGRTIAGALPSFALGSSDDLEDGRIIPTTSVEQYGAALGRWFGLSDTDLQQVFPNLNRFASDTVNVLR